MHVSEDGTLLHESSVVEYVDVSLVTDEVAVISRLPKSTWNENLLIFFVTVVFD